MLRRENFHSITAVGIVLDCGGLDPKAKCKPMTKMRVKICFVPAINFSTFLLFYPDTLGPSRTMDGADLIGGDFTLLHFGHDRTLPCCYFGQLPL